MVNDRATSIVFLTILEKFRGFAFITYEDKNVTEKVLEKIHKLKGKQV